MINRVVLVGRITRDPEVQQTNTGISYCRFSVAVNRPFKGPNGERQTDFINCIAWRNQADYMGNYIHKGNMVDLEGRIQVNSYQDQNGNNRQVVDILVDTINNLEPANRNSDNGYQPQPPYEYQQNNYQQTNVSHEEPTKSSTEFEVSEDDLPF